MVAYAVLVARGLGLMQARVAELKKLMPEANRAAEGVWLDNLAS